jgi:integrase
MPVSTEIERRNRALLAFTILTGMRDRAIASIKLKHIDVIEKCVHQDARDVKTKFSKTFSTFFFPIDDDIEEIVLEWIMYLKEEKLWGNEDPLFPVTNITLNRALQFEAAGIKKEHWQTASPIRKIFQDAFTTAGLPYFNPHSFRNTLARLGEELCHTPEEFKAWSQNLGHEKVLTTFTSYGEVSYHRQGELIRNMGDERDSISVDYQKMMLEIWQRMKKEAA